jgi:hypothetical protein
MCDPVTLLVAGGAALGGTAFAMNKAARGSAAAADPEAERLKAEADAASAANRRLAADKLRRREQQSLIARGAPAPSLGDDETLAGGTDLLTSRPLSSSRRNAGSAVSLISRGSVGVTTVGGGGGGSRSGRSSSVPY